MIRRLICIIVLLTCVSTVAAATATPHVKASTETALQSDDNRTETPAARVRPARKKSSAYKSWKRRLPFWPRKGFMLTELALFITAGVLVAQMLEVSGLIRYLSVLAWPITRLGRLGRHTGPAFLMAFQSGAVANSMLVSTYDKKTITTRQLYTSVLVVSCLSLFAHLPTYVLPIGSLLGAQATMMLFGVRFAAIVVEIIVLLLVSNFLIRPWAEKAAAHGAGTAVPDIATPASNPSKQKKFWPQVWSRSRRTLRRLMIYLIPTFAVMVSLEYFGFFGWLKVQVPGLFTFSFLPAQSVAIIPAQAASLYNGAVVAANFVKEGAISTHQAVLIILIGSLVTAPVRTLKHALPTYVAILGPKRGLVLAVSAQVLRSIFLILFVVVLWRVWR